jgi:Protein of unknown function (DUF3568)
MNRRNSFVLDVHGHDGWISGDMRIKALFSLALASALVLASGCVNTETGHTVGGVPFTKDTITSRYEKPVAQLASATRVVLTRNGKLLVDNVVDNSFRAKVNQRNVWVKVTDLDGKITVVSVQARGSMGGDVDLAAEISKQIALQLMAGPNP